MLWRSAGLACPTNSGLVPDTGGRDQPCRHNPKSLSFNDSHHPTTATIPIEATPTILTPVHLSTAEHTATPDPFEERPQHPIYPHDKPLSSTATMSQRQLARDMQTEFQARVRTPFFIYGSHTPESTHRPRY